MRRLIQPCGAQVRAGRAALDDANGSPARHPRPDSRRRAMDPDLGLSAPPSPKWIQPSSPPAWPPPTVTSRSTIRSPSLTSIQAPIASGLGPSLRRRTREPVAHRLRLSASPAPTLRHSGTFSRAVHLDQVEQAVEVEVDQRRPAAARRVDDAGCLGALDERAVGLAEKQVARVLRGVVGHRLDVALGDEQVHEAVVVDVLELGMPGGRG